MLAVFRLLSPMSVLAEEESTGQAWSRVIRHCDGTQTKSVKAGDKDEISEEKYDENHVLLSKRLFLLDKRGHLRTGILMDAKGNALARTEYGYNKSDKIVEERLFNAANEVIQRKFPPGTIPGLAVNVHHSVVFTIDPKNPTALGKMAQTDEPLVTPVTSPDDSFEPGSALGQPAAKPPTGSPMNTAPVSTENTRGRKPGLFRSKK